MIYDSCKPQITSRTALEVWAEVGVVLLVLLVPIYHSIFASLFHSIPGAGPPDEHSSLSELFRSTFKDISAGTLLLYLMWRSEEPWSRFGLLRSINLTLDASIVLFVILINAAVSEGLFLLFDAAGLDKHPPEPVSAPAESASIAYAALFVHICISAFFEELLMRGYFLPRFERLLHSTWVSLFLTALVFGGLHLDQGIEGVLVTSLAGLVYGGAFCWFRRLWPVVAAHIVYNLMVMLAPRLMDTFVT